MIWYLLYTFFSLNCFVKSINSIVVLAVLKTLTEARGGVLLIYLNYHRLSVSIWMWQWEMNPSQLRTLSRKVTITCLGLLRSTLIPWTLIFLGLQSACSALYLTLTHLLKPCPCALGNSKSSFSSITFILHHFYENFLHLPAVTETLLSPNHTTPLKSPFTVSPAP